MANLPGGPGRLRLLWRYWTSASPHGNRTSSPLDPRSHGLGALSIPRRCHRGEGAPTRFAWGAHPLATCGQHPALLVLAPFRRQSKRVMLARTEMQMQEGHTDARVLIVDDQPSFRRAARSVVELTPGFELVGEAETGEASVAAARALQPDLVLMDVHL